MIIIIILLSYSFFINEMVVQSCLYIFMTVYKRRPKDIRKLRNKHIATSFEVWTSSYNCMSKIYFLTNQKDWISSYNSFGRKCFWRLPYGTLPILDHRKQQAMLPQCIGWLCEDPNSRPCYHSVLGDSVRIQTAGHATTVYWVTLWGSKQQAMLPQCIGWLCEDPNSRPCYHSVLGDSVRIQTVLGDSVRIQTAGHATTVYWVTLWGSKQQAMLPQCIGWLCEDLRSSTGAHCMLGTASKRLRSLSLLIPFINIQTSCSHYGK